MAGDEFKRPNYMRTTVVGGIINDTPSITDSVVGSLINGPAMRFRKFHKWADRTDYNDTIGLVTGDIKAGNSISREVVEGELPSTPGAITELQSVIIDDADFSWWADQYVLTNFPERIGTDYVADYDSETNLITITWEDTTTSSFTPSGYDRNASYLYATYVEYYGDVPQDLVVGPEITLDPLDPFPDITGWTEIYYTDDGLGTTAGLWERITFIGPVAGENATYSEKEFMYQNESAGVRTYQIDEQDIWHSAASPMITFIYKQLSGNAVLDAMWDAPSDMNGFYPFIPLRVDNKFLSEDFLPTVYEQAKKGYKKATTGDYDDMIESLEENPDLGDIDYTYVVFGVCLNVMEQTSRKYIYQFFKEIMNDYTMLGNAAYTAYQVAWFAAKNSWDDWYVWRAAQDNESDPLFGTPAPAKLAYPPMPVNSMRVAATANPTMNYDMTISWNSIGESSGSGLLKPDAKRDQLWFTKGDTDTFTESIWGVDPDTGEYGPIEGGETSTDTVYLNWQVTETEWVRLTIVGLKHKNLIYNGKAVEITAFEALDDAEESGFIIPLHDGVFRSIGLVDSTQMSTACCFMVFNCYQVVKQKWYQTTLFKIILIIIIIVIAIYTGYFDPSTAGGVLGSNAVVGAALGLTGTAAIIVGAVANAIAAMLITKLVTAASVSLFGEKWGAIIGAVASIIALQVGTAMASGQTMANSFSGLMRADNILRLTEAAGKGYAGYIQGANADLMAQQEQVLKDYEKESRMVREAWENNLGGINGIIDTASITSAFGVTMESVDSFLQRTLMTGSDVADMSMNMLTNFVDMTINTDLPT